MSENETKNTSPENEEVQYSLNDDRRVKVLSPGAMVAKRFFRNRIAVVGLSILAFMFLFSFLGGIITPYTEDEQFYRSEYLNKEYAGVVQNVDFRFVSAEGQDLGSVLQAQVVLATQRGNDSFTYRDVDYQVIEEGTDFYRVTLADGTTLGIAYKDIVNSSVEGAKISYDFYYNALLAYTNESGSFSADGKEFTIDENGVVSDGSNEVAFISRYVVQPIMSDVFLSRDFQEMLIVCLEDGQDTFTYTDENGETAEYSISYRPDVKNWSVRQQTETRIYDTYAAPSAKHWLGTDRNGMDMMTRLMYGGRVSLIIGFIVEIISTVLGIIMGGLAGYFGHWVDNLIMRIVDIFYCIPSMPIIIILGAAMDAMSVDPQIRMLYLMLILGFLGWPGMARLIRGQILSLREQEFMTATEACGISVSRRIFKHLVPNVIPQIIVSVSMGIGGTILTEATLSFLGLGVKFPFASWGNIINDVNNTFVLTTYWFIWIPAGLLLLLTVLAFNLVGDGLRDAFDPKMKR
ncbi:MAG: ABC transporter permease [Oscillospiraceae bacterium]|nr:ABC transporter permease [Oscillospiraceae bacterium]